jgi:uncharacterized protein YdeI (YjbR/CyaY-like superfamily)
LTPTFFKSAAAFEKWLSRHHATTTELFVGLYKKHAAHRGMTYPEAVDVALCWGWIDGVLRRIDEDRVVQRYTPRKPRSNWSLVNIGKVKRLLAAGRMQPPGIAAYEAREAKRTGVYSFEKAAAVFTPKQLREFKRSAAAWKWFSAQPPGYRKLATHWVTSAKQEATRARRLAALVWHSAKGERLPQWAPFPRRDR